MTRHFAAVLLVASLQPAPMPGYAARHRFLPDVARARGMDATGVLFASPIAPIGARLCVSSAVMPEPVCGLVVDGPRPEHRQWQIQTGRIIEVDPQLAGRLCRDATGPPRSCPVIVTVKIP